MLRRLPRRFDRITTALEQGRLGVNVRLFADERDRLLVTGLTHQFLLTFALHDLQEPVRIFDFSRSNSSVVMTPWSRSPASLVSSSAALFGPAASCT